MNTEDFKDFSEDKKWCKKLAWICMCRLWGWGLRGLRACVYVCNCAPLSATVFHLLEASQACGSSGCSHGKWATRFLPCSTWRLWRPSNIENLPLQQWIQVLWKTWAFKAAGSISSWSHCWLSYCFCFCFFLSWPIRGIWMAHSLLWS